MVVGLNLQRFTLTDYVPPTLGLRERRKRETELAVARVAQDLVYERGLNAVTVEDIARAAGVSVSTFFNYFSCKVEAVIGIPQAVLDDVSTRLRARPSREGVIDSLRSVITDWTEQEDTLSRGRIRYELVIRNPTLKPYFLAGLTELESALAVPLAERMAIDLQVDPSPRVLVGAVLGALQAASLWRESSGREMPFDRVLQLVFDQVTTTESS